MINNDHLYHKCDQMILLVASAASSSTKIRSLSHFYVWTEQTCFSLCKQTLSVSAFYTNIVWVRQLLGCDNSRKPGISHTNHDAATNLTASIEPKIRGRSNLAYVCICFSKRKNQYMLSCMVVSGLVPTSAICHGVCKWCAFELKTTQLSELTASYMLFCVWTVLPKTLGVDKFGCIPTWWGRSLLSMPFVDVRNLPGEFLCRPAPPHITHTWLIDTNQECEKPSINHSSSSCCWCSIYMITTLHVCFVWMSSTFQRNYPKLSKIEAPSIDVIIWYYLALWGIMGVLFHFRSVGWCAANRTL